MSVSSMIWCTDFENCFTWKKKSAERALDGSVRQLGRVNCKETMQLHSFLSKNLLLLMSPRTKVMSAKDVDKVGLFHGIEGIWPNGGQCDKLDEPNAKKLYDPIPFY